DVTHEPLLDELVDELLAEALDVHGAARAEEAELLLQLGRAGEPDAAVGHLALGAHDLRAAHRAGGRHAEALLAALPPLGHHLHDVRDHVARALEEDGVADADVLALDLVHVVERRVADGHPAHLHRLELRHGRQHARASDGGEDVHDARRRLARLELQATAPRGAPEVSPSRPLSPASVPLTAI